MDIQGWNWLATNTQKLGNFISALASGDECQGVPMAEGGWSVHPSTLGALAVPGRHVGLHPGLVDEDQPARIRLGLKALPPLAAVLHIGAVLLVDHRRQLLAGGAAGLQKAPDRGDARRDAPLAKQVPQQRQDDGGFVRPAHAPLRDHRDR